ncbi:SbcC/MukB-like Walker B domain-containing protein [Tengunoibacter tsumagoiensis]|uniref:Rad50/SbcC-type AAA domain-containing protein n=1 Tax=Tengunoibacter tsumagoiensis TaxID=2014871 RepID=A0A401ZVP2_9CHLR|nr:SbcC/MukB-like Walker B domain-containing protein [Tengunoibacter tsumagoiensis]GCE10820.1 hypothetical protein KTT_06790 [Tengunoibacter tsumagoiensis]
MVNRLQAPLLDEGSEEVVRQLADRLQTVDGGPVGYRLRRVILTNFWLYEHQEFEIPHGRLFLAGENASGKSTVLMAALPLALDGDYRPERIDTFGKREKRIDYYIVGSNDSATPFVRDQRTSYVALEFEWCNPDEPPFASELRAYWEQGDYERARFLTIGLVFSGNRNNVHPVNAFRFLITDGSRLEYDLPTFQEHRDGRKAQDFKSFKKTVAEHGIVCDTAREYEQKVSHYLFNFANVNDFKRLIKQLLYLRQPNLNSAISLEKVREFLDQSLPQIPDDLLQQAATTLELMDTLQDEIARRKKAYDAVEQLHAAQQSLTIAQVRLAAGEYIHEQQRENELHNEVLRHKRMITRSENEMARMESRIVELEREQAQVTGRISALEGSEGLQAVQRLNQVSARVAELRRALEEQQQILSDAIAHREENARDVEQQQQDFFQARSQATQLLETMQRRAEHEAHWEIAANQIATIVAQVQQIALEQTTPQLSVTLPALMSSTIASRLTWLRTLRQLHQELQQASNHLQMAQQQERKLYDEVDEQTRQFEQAREETYSAQQNLADRLDQLLEQSDFLPPGYFTQLHEQAIQFYNETHSPRETATLLEQLLSEYTARLQQALELTRITITQMQQRSKELSRKQGGKQHELALAQEQYERILQQPEALPYRLPHRIVARERLAQQGIQALPLYMLLDFTPELDSQVAGGIEQTLADAGLLDALVVLPSEQATVDAFLTHEGLADCRLQLSNHSQHLSTRWLRCDPALIEQLGERYPIWEETLQQTIAVVEQTLYSEGSVQWQHGLLRGQQGSGTVRYIGKANRQREQQVQLAALQQQLETLTTELQQLITQIETNEQQRQELLSLQSALHTVMKESQFEAGSLSVQASLTILEQAQSRYQNARNETQQIRLQIQQLRIHLHKEANGDDLFLNDAARIDQAYDQTNLLAREGQTIQGYLQNLLRSWQGFQKATRLLDQARAAEFRTAQAQRRVEQEAEQAQAELATLREILTELEGENVESLFEQLRDLQERLKSLPGELQEAHTARGKSETVLEATREAFTQAQERLTHVQQVCQKAYTMLLTFLESYPVEQFYALRQRMHQQANLEAAQSLLDEPLQPAEEAYLASKLTLDRERNTAYNQLFVIFSDVSNLLHDYGISVDPQGTVRFLNAENATPFELLTRLAEEISQQEKLLDERERTLFQHFLLKEMADTIRKHIVDAESWVSRMNTVLSHTAFVEEHYRLNWVLKEPDQVQAGGQLAQFYHLLRRPAQSLKEDEVEALVNAFRQEIVSLRANQQSTNALPFTEALAQIFDYRDWFRFEVYVSRPDGSRQHLTERFFKQRSGAEQYIALYVPFFAALSALYESAGKGAPRLIALDEAFDKVSLNNTQRLLKFLASQHFQWIMSGPRVSGEGTEIPASVRYVMLHQKGTELATGFPSFWSTDQNMLLTEKQ